ncbi:adenosine deaminase, partial [Mesorhizobium sp. M8A.F.Ca.ET.059.01.1.1]
MPLKAELHCHIEGAAAPELVIRQAQKYGKDTSPYIQNGSFVWHDFTSFLAAYDFSADLFRTEEDYARLADHYLTSLARDGAIYSEVFTSPDHATKAGLSPKAYTDALGEGMLRAKAKTGIEGRMIVTGVRHVGVESIERAARFAARCGHPLVTGFGVAGDERMGDMEDYVRAFEIA